MLKIMQGCRDSWLGLATGKPPIATHEWSVQKRWTITPTRALQDKKSSLAILLTRSLNSRLSQVARPSCQPTLFGKNWLFAFLSHPTIYKPLYPRNIESSKSEFLGKNPREKQDWLIPNLHIETLQIPLLSFSPLLHPWEVHYQNFFSHHTHICKKAIWWYGK